MNQESIIINQEDCPWLTRDVYPMTELGRVRWKILLSADRTPSRALSMGVAELPPGQQLTPHQHPQIETYFILEGEGEVRIGDRGDRVQRVTPGTAVFIPGDAIHTIVNTGASHLRVLFTFPTDSFDEVQYNYIGILPES